MKLIVQIPCYNEEDTLPQTVADIPRAIEGVDQVEILIVDDGSSDRTIQRAVESGVDHVVRHKKNLGLARAFRTGIDACLRLGADVIVNTDGDNQYAGRDIPRLISPILEGRADIVIGDRRTGAIAHFSPTKKALQYVGSAMVRRLSETGVRDAVSGFRAISREAALQLNVISPFSYTIEMLIQAGKKNLAISEVPVATNPKTRDSRLFASIPRFIERSLTNLARTYAMYQPLRIFMALGIVLALIGLVPIARFLYIFFFFRAESTGHIQSLVLGGVFVLMGFVTFMIGLIADLIAFNRQLIEMALEGVRRIELEDRPGRADRPQRRPGKTNDGLPSKSTG